MKAPKKAIIVTVLKVIGESLGLRKKPLRGFHRHLDEELNRHEKYWWV